MASKPIDLAGLADRVAQILEKSKVNLARRTKGRTQLIDAIRLAITGAPRPDRKDCLVPLKPNGPAGANTMFGPGGVVQMTPAESERADEELGYRR